MAVIRKIEYLDANVLLVVFLVFAVEPIYSLEPRFSVDPEPVSARVGENLALRCTISPPAPVLWFMNGLPLISNTSYDFRSDEVTGEHEVIIKNISVLRDGQYYCRMQNQPVKSQPAQVTVLVAPTAIHLDPFSPETTVQENVEATLVCHIDGGKPAPVVQWFKDDQAIDSGVDTHIAAVDSVSKIENVTSILKWMPVRGEQSKRVFCTATHQALQGGPLRVETQLTVEYAPIVKITSVPDVIKAGEPVTLQCDVDANPGLSDLKFRWMKNGQLLPDVTVANLRIEQAQRSESPVPMYSCDASNRIGNGTASFEFKVQYPPSFYSMPDVRAADLNKEILLVCNVDANPPALLSWFREPSSQVLAYTKVLSVQLDSEADFGTYTCVAASPGYPPIRKEMKILKKGPPFISAEASVYASQSETSVQIKCVINGLPLAESINWTNPQGKPSSSDSDPRIEISRDVLSDRVISKLTIKNVKKDDFGMYNCSAGNALGRNERLIPLKETDWMLPIIIGCAVGGGILLVLIVVAAFLCARCRRHQRFKQASDTSGSTTTSDDLDTKSPNGVLHPNTNALDMYNTSSNETLADPKNPPWLTANPSDPLNQDILHARPFTIHADYKDAQNYYTRYADYEQEYNPNSFGLQHGLPAIYTPTMSITEQHEQEGSRDPSPYTLTHHTSGLPSRPVEPLYSRYPALNGSVMMLDATLNSRLATNV